MKTADYIAAVKAKLQITSDYALAKALKTTRQSASRWALGQGVPGTLVAFKIAEILGDQPAAVIADFELERAEKAAKADDADEWKAWVKKFGGAAAGILLAAGLGGFSNADAQLARTSADSTPYTSSKTRRRGWWGGPLSLAL